MTQRKGVVVDVLLGGMVGAILGGIVAVNVVLMAGVDQGYESGIGEIFDENLFLGLITVVIWIAGPVLGIWFARRRRKRSLRADRGE